MTPLKFVLFLQCLAFVSGCQQSYEPNYLSTSAPAELSRISSSVLSLKMTINGTEQYDGRLQEDGSWVVRPQGLELGVDHTVVNEWYGQFQGENYLLMRQRGSFYADPVTLQAVLNLPSVTSGTAEFDSDCDSLTNIDEFSVGSDPNSPPGCEADVGTDPIGPPTTTSLQAWVEHNFQEFVTSGYVVPVKSVDQEILIRSFDANKGMSFGMTIHNNLDQAAPDDRLNIALTQSMDGVKFAEISMILPLGIQMAAGGSCYEGIENSSRLACGVPFDWQLDRWYTLRVAESEGSGLGFSFWEGWIIDQESGDTILLGSMLTFDSYIMQSASVGISYYFGLDQTECTEGLPTSTINYMSATLNDNDFVTMPLAIQPGPCAESGGGWTSDDSIVDAENNPIFSLTLGR